MKKCRRCGRKKKAEAFVVNKQNVDQLDSWCRACHTDYGRERAAKAERHPCACGCGTPTKAAWAPGHATRKLPSEERRRRAHAKGCGTYVKEGGRRVHRRVAEEKIGRKLRKGEIVHHANGNIHDNRHENLIVTTQSKHIRHHLHGEAL